MIIRPIRKSDLEAWVKMRSALWPEGADCHPTEIAQFFDGTSIDIVAVLVADDPEMGAAGFIELNIRNFAEGSRECRVPYVEAWYVEPAVRARGIGTALMRRAEKWAVERGFSELASDAELENEKSIAMHKDLGFQETERVVCFLKKLG